MKKYKMLLILTYLFNITDMAATISLCRRFGYEIEGNPIGRVLLSSPALLLFYKITVVAIMLMTIYKYIERPLAVAGTYIVFGAYGLLCLYHLFIVLMV